MGALIALGAAQPAPATDATTDTTTAAAAAGGLEEIAVTAEKYNSTIQNTPISMSAISGEQLIAAGITRSKTWSECGLVRAPAGPANGIRGTRPRFQRRRRSHGGLRSRRDSAVAAGAVADRQSRHRPDLYDVSIEVLRGPQGTLYGSGSMGGTVKIVTNQPKVYPGGVRPRDPVGHHGGSGNGGGSFMVNVPIGEHLAVRLLATDTYRSGWLDRWSSIPSRRTCPRRRALPLPVLRTPNVLAARVIDVVTNVNTESLYGAR